MFWKEYTASIFKVKEMLSKQKASGPNDQIIAQRQATMNEVSCGFL
jgi:hypothetical protein